jgi:hypothetical protein
MLVYTHGEHHICHAGLHRVRSPSWRHAPCPGRGGGEVDRLRVGAPRSFRLAPNRGRDLPVADSSGLPTPGTDFDLTGSYRVDNYD